MQTEFIYAVILTIATFLIGAGIIVAAIIGRHTIFNNAWGCLILLGAILLVGSIFVMPIGIEEHHSQVTVLKTENVNGVWNVYFDDGGSIRSVKCTESNPWHSFKEGEHLQIKYGSINSISNMLSNHYQLIEVVR